MNAGIGAGLRWVLILLTLCVVIEAQITADPAEVEFGKVDVGERVIKHIAIQSIGQGVEEITYTLPSDLRFIVPPPPVMPSGVRVILWLEYFPSKAEQVRGVIRVGSLSIPVTGTAVGGPIPEFRTRQNQTDISARGCGVASVESEHCHAVATWILSLGQQDLPSISTHIPSGHGIALKDASADLASGHPAAPHHDSPPPSSLATLHSSPSLSPVAQVTDTFLETIPFAPIAYFSQDSLIASVNIVVKNRGRSVNIGRVYAPSPLPGSTLTTNCAGALADGAMCTITATFTFTGAYYMGEEIDISAPSGPLLQRTGASAELGYPRLVSRSNTVDFGAVSVSHSRQTTVELISQGAQTPVVATVQGSSMYRVGGCKGKVDRFGRCILTISFSPTAVQPANATLEIKTSQESGTLLSIALSGRGVPNTLGVSQTSLHFSGSDNELQSIQIDNPTDRAQTVLSSLITGPFQTINQCGVLQPSESCTIDVQYTPIPLDAGAPDHGRLSIFTTDGDPIHQVDLSVAKNLSDVAVSTNSVQFPSQQVGADSAPQAVTITNSGTRDATVATTVAGDFAMAKGCNGSIPAGHSCVVTITFSPSSAGSRSGTLLVSGSNILHPISLIGTGVTPPPPPHHGLNPGISVAGGGLAVGLPLGLPLMLHHKKGDTALSSLAITPAQLALSCEGVGCLARGTVTIVERKTEHFGLIFMAAGPVHLTGCTTVKDDGKCVLSVDIRPSADGDSRGFIAISDSEGKPLKLIAVSGSLLPAHSLAAHACRQGPECAAEPEVQIITNFRNLPACSDSSRLSFRSSWLGRQDQS